MDKIHRIREAWSFDWQNHGDAAILNRQLLKARVGGVCMSITSFSSSFYQYFVSDTWMVACHCGLCAFTAYERSSNRTRGSLSRSNGNVSLLSAMGKSSYFISVGLWLPRKCISIVNSHMWLWFWSNRRWWLESYLTPSWTKEWPIWTLWLPWRPLDATSGPRTNMLSNISRHGFHGSSGIPVFFAYWL